VVPTSGGASAQYDLWVSRVIADPTLQTTGAMSQALAGTPQFMTLYATNSATEPATLAVVTQMCESLLGIPPGPGALLNVGLPVWQVLQNFVTSPVVIAKMDAPIANFQNLLLAGETPTGSIFALPGTGGTTFTLTSGVDSPTAGFTTGHGATAMAAGSVFEALPSSNPPLGVTNTIQAGDDLEATGAAAGATKLNYLSRFRLANQRIGFLRFDAAPIRKVYGMAGKSPVTASDELRVGLLALADSRDRGEAARRTGRAPCF
jgi:hypothetical protein